MISPHDLRVLHGARCWVSDVFYCKGASRAMNYISVSQQIARLAPSSYLLHRNFQCFSRKHNVKAECRSIKWR